MASYRGARPLNLADNNEKGEMAYKINRKVLTLCLAAAIFSALLLPASGYGENLRFVFMADSRGDSLTEPINTPVLNAIIAQIMALSPPPAFVFFGGDMAYRGCINGTYTFQTFKDLFAPLTSAGITLYTVIGNHELYQHSKQNPGSDQGFFLDNQKTFQNTFTDNPDNGPPGYERLTYCFPSPGGDALFVVLDPYYLTADDPDPSLGGNIDFTQLIWLEIQALRSRATHKFLFIHTPAYYVTGSDPTEPPSSANISFTYLWSLLDQFQFDFYACGHAHLYSRKTIDKSVLPSPQTDPPRPLWRNKVVQLLNGTCGAPVDTGTPIVDPNQWHFSNAPNTYYFSVVDISGKQVKVTSYSGSTGEYSVFDSFIINSTDLSGVYLMLMD
jgi:hypothetical protein